jgi:co-chaperonin GroES (HSP10)
MNITLLGNRVHVRRELPPTTTGGIYLPESVRDDSNNGGVKVYRVLGVGPGFTNKKGVHFPIECAPGDRVMCHSYTTGPTELEDGTMIVTADQILAVLPVQPATTV